MVAGFALADPVKRHGRGIGKSRIGGLLPDRHAVLNLVAELMCNKLFFLVVEEKNHSQ